MRPWRPKIKKSHLEVEFRHTFSSDRSKVIEAIEAVFKVAVVVEATEAIEGVDSQYQDALHQRIMLQKDVSN